MEKVTRYCDACGEEMEKQGGSITFENVSLNLLRVEYCPTCFWKALRLMGFSQDAGIYLSHAKQEGLSNGGESIITVKPNEPKVAAMLEYYENIRRKLE